MEKKVKELTEDRKEITLRHRVLNFVSRGTPQSQKKKSKQTYNEDEQQHVLYTTYEPENLKQVVHRNETIPIVSVKSLHTIVKTPVKQQTQVSYCASCGHSSKSSSLKPSEKHSKTSSPRPYKEVQKELKKSDVAPVQISLKREEVIQVEIDVQENKTQGNNIKETKIQIPVIIEPEEVNDTVNDQKQSGEQKESIKEKYTPQKVPLIRSNSYPFKSPKKEEKETQVLEQRTNSVKQAIIEKSTTLYRAGGLIRRHTSDSLKSSEIESNEQIALWRQQVKAFQLLKPGTLRQHTTIFQYSKIEEAQSFSTGMQYGTAKATAFSSSCYSTRIKVVPTGNNGNKTTMPKIKNGSNNYPLLRTKIPEEQVGADGMVTVNSPGKASEIDRDSGVDIDASGKHMYVNSYDSDIDDNSDVDSALTLDSIQLSLNKNDEKTCLNDREKIKDDTNEQKTKEETVTVQKPTMILING